VISAAEIECKQLSSQRTFCGADADAAAPSKQKETPHVRLATTLPLLLGCVGVVEGGHDSVRRAWRRYQERVSVEGCIKRGG